MSELALNPDQVLIIEDDKVVAVYNTKTEVIFTTDPGKIPIKLNHYRQVVKPFTFIICVES